MRLRDLTALGGLGPEKTLGDFFRLTSGTFGGLREGAEGGWMGGLMMFERWVGGGGCEFDLMLW